VQTRRAVAQLILLVRFVVQTTVLAKLVALFMALAARIIPTFVFGRRPNHAYTTNGVLGPLAQLLRSVTLVSRHDVEIFFKLGILTLMYLANIRLLKKLRSAVTYNVTDIRWNGYPT
jgi:hypothetical protein